MRIGFPPDRLHARIDNGMSPLMLAALKGERTLVEELLALGADPNHVNDDDHHALWFACVHGNPELVSLLTGASVSSICTGERLTPIDIVEDETGIWIVDMRVRSLTPAN